MDIEKLVNSNLVKLGRAADLLWLSFGKPVTITTDTGTREVNEYALHVQCPWRFTKDNSVILGARDIYDPLDPALDLDSDWNWDEFDRDISKQSVFEANSQTINENLLPLIVNGIVQNDNGDLRIEFTKNVVFEVFITGLRKYEYWRFIDFNTHEHYVVFDD